MIGYHVYANTGIGDPISYVSPLATVWTTSWTSPPLSGSGTWSYDVRAFDSLTGLEEQNIDSITVNVDASGNDVSNTPAAPVSLSVLARAGGSIRVDWAYPRISVGAAPTGFHVYLGSGGSPDYTNPVATVVAGTALLGQYTTLIKGLTNGVTYQVGVRAFNATAEEKNTFTTSVVALSVGPEAVVGLTGVATSSSS
jgi:Fibronectin type III domain